MKSKLSAWKYIRNNKKSTAVLVIALSLCFAGIYVISYLLGTTVESFRPVLKEIPKYETHVNLTWDTLGIHEEDYSSEEEFVEAARARRADFLNFLRNHEGIDDAFLSELLMAQYKGVVGQMNYNFPLLEPEQVSGYLKHHKATLKEGRLPKGKGEVACDEIVMKNNGYKIGDYMCQEYFGEVFQIVGILDSPDMTCVGTSAGGANNGWGITILTDESTCDFSQLAKEYGISLGVEDSVDDMKSNAKSYQEDVVDMCQGVINMTSMIVAVFLAFAIIIAYISKMRNRMNEYCLYASIGYKRSEIYGMMLREMFLSFGMGTLMGAGLALGFGLLMQKVLIEPRGLFGALLRPEQLLTNVALFVMVMGILQIPVLLSLRKVKTIDMIED